jgi:hypothetical protein
LLVDVVHGFSHFFLCFIYVYISIKKGGKHLPPF